MTKLLGTFLQKTEHFYKSAIKPPQMHFSLKTKQDQAQLTRSMKLTCHRLLIF